MLTRIRRRLLNRTVRPFLWRVLGASPYPPSRDHIKDHMVSYDKLRIAKFLQLGRVDGDYYEFGVFAGASLIEAYNLPWHEASPETRMNEGLERSGHPSPTAATPFRRRRRFIGFDSFAGLPLPKGRDTSVSSFSEGDYSSSLSQCSENLRSAGLDLDRVTLVEGWYQDTLTAETIRRAGLEESKAAWVFVDCDLYESTKLVLDFLTGIVQDGTVITFDDWIAYRSNPAYGEQAAFREWLERNPNLRAEPFFAFQGARASFVLFKDENSL